APNGNKLTQTFADDVPINAEIVALITSQLAQMEQRLLLAIRKSQVARKSDIQCPFLRRKEAIKLLGTRSTLERCEKAGWITATTRRPRLVQYKREEVLAAVYRISQGEYP
ncbi:MAG TPA: hypothetical protein VGH07_02570, partial [Chthoniobacterales bacterium]